MIDEQVEAFLADILALEGEDVNAIREGEKAAHAYHALCRARVVEEIRLHKGTPTAEHLKLVLSAIDGPHFP